MNRRMFSIIVGMCALLALVLMSSSGAVAQSPGPKSVTSPQANVGTGFTYQGQLKQGGNTITANCDMAFRLYDDASVGSQVGNAITPTVPITNGLFTVQLDFGASAFTGDARWLDIQVACPSGSAYTALTPRQPLTPAPIALALPGLYTQQNTMSPNIIGGYSGNTVAPGISGATISGGGWYGIGNGTTINKVTGDFGSIGGGIANTASGPFSTVAGGATNTASGSYATVGGAYNVAGNYGSAVAGGLFNTANGNGAFVGGGGYLSGGGMYVTGNAASGDASTIGGGLNNTASGAGSFIGGGGYNGSGYNGNQADAAASTIGGGYGNVITTTGTYATVPGGVNAMASHYGELAYASGNFNTPGDAQTSIYVLRNTTIGAMQVELFLDGSSQRLTIANNHSVTFDILVVGRDSTGASGGYQFRGVIKKVGSTTSLVGAVAKTVIAEDDATWDANVAADNAHGSLKITVSGTSGLTSSEWVATVRTVEVGY